MENPRITALKEQLAQDLLNPAFYQLTTEQQKARVDLYIANGVPFDYASNLINVLAAQQKAQQPKPPSPQKQFTPPQKQFTPPRVPTQEELIAGLSNLLNDPKSVQLPNLSQQLNAIRNELNMGIAPFNELIRELWTRDTNSIIQLGPNINVINVPFTPHTRYGIRQAAQREAQKERYAEELSNLLNAPGSENLPDLPQRLNALRTALEMPISTFNELIKQLWKKNTSVIVQLRGGGAGGVTTFMLRNTINPQLVISPVTKNTIPPFTVNKNLSPIKNQQPILIQPTINQKQPNVSQATNAISKVTIDRLRSILNVPQDPEWHSSQALEQIRQYAGLDLDSFNKLIGGLYWDYPNSSMLLTPGRAGDEFYLQRNVTGIRPNGNKSEATFRRILGDYINSGVDLRTQAEILNRYRHEINLNMDPNSFNRIIAQEWRGQGWPPKIVISRHDGRMFVIFAPPQLTNDQLIQLIDQPIASLEEVEDSLGLNTGEALELWDQVRPLQPPDIQQRTQRLQDRIAQQQRQRPQQRQVPEFLRQIDPGLIDQTTAILLRPDLATNPDRTLIFDEVRGALRLSDEEFNQYLQYIWPTQPAPVYTRNILGGLKVTGGQIAQIGRTMRPGYLSPQEAIEELEGFVDNVIMPVAEKEIRLFGTKGILLKDLKNLYTRVARIAKAIRTRPVEQSRQEMDDVLDRLLGELNVIAQEQQLLGKRCLNSETPILQTPVDELTEDEFIRLDGGVCWENAELIEFIKDRKGQNDLSNLRNYPSKSKKIWENEEEFNKILSIPGANQIEGAGANGEDFVTWLKYITTIGLANRVSNETLNMMYWAASLLSSRGKPFREAARREMAQDPRLLRAWREIGENFRNIDRIIDPAIKTEIVKIVNEVLKSEAIAAFHAYFNGLSDDERDAIGTYEAKFATQVEACKNAKYCVFGLSDTLIATRNSIAIVKELPIIDLDND